MTEYLAMVFYGYSDWLCYITGALIILVMIAVFKRGEIPKPKKTEIWGWVQAIINYLERRKEK